MGWYVTVYSVGDREGPANKDRQGEVEKLWKFCGWIFTGATLLPPACMHFWRYRQPAASVWFHMCCLFLIRTTWHWNCFCYRPTVNTTSEPWLHTFRLLWRSVNDKCYISTICVNVQHFFLLCPGRRGADSASLGDFTSAMTFFLLNCIFDGAVSECVLPNCQVIKNCQMHLTTGLYISPTHNHQILIWLFPCYRI